MMALQWQHHPPEVQLELFPEGFQESTAPQLTVLSFGAGQDSMALLYLLALDRNFRNLYAPKDFIVIFSDTGAEHQETYQEALPQSIHFCTTQNIPFFWIKPGSQWHSNTWPSLIEHYQATGTCGSKGFRKSCTDQLKIQPIYRWLEFYLTKAYGIPGGRKQGFYRYAAKHGKLRVLIGLTVDEGKRCKMKGRPLWMRRCIEIRFPLQEIRAKRRHAQGFIEGFKKPVPCPSSCRVCPYLTYRDLLWKHRCREEEYQELLELETAKREKWAHLGAKNYGVFGPMTLPQALHEAERRFGHMSNDELNTARMIDGHAVASGY